MRILPLAAVNLCQATEAPWEFVYSLPLFLPQTGVPSLADNSEGQAALLLSKSPANPGYRASHFHRAQ